MKKFMSLLMAIVMVFCLATPVGAINTEDDPNENQHTITITNTAGNDVYEAYQVFSGDIADEKLTNITWGSGVNGSALLTALKADEDLDAKFAECTTAVDVAEVLNDLKAAELEKFADLVAANLKETKATSGTPSATTVEGKTTYTYEITVTGDGYYFVKDQNGTVGEGEAYTKYILKVTNDILVSAKSAVPTVDKQVWDEDGDQDLNAKVDEEGNKDNWGETADHDINETFQFKLIATLPSDEDFAKYDAYKVEFNDTMSEGITFEGIVSVTVDGETISAGQNGYICSIPEGEEKAGGTWTLTINNIKSISNVDLTDGAVIEVIYNAHLNEAAVVGNVDVNKNTVYLKYSNNPNAGGENELGETPKDHVWVFTYEVDVTKVDGKDNSVKLENAEFSLYKMVGNTKSYAIVDTNKEVQGWTHEIDEEEYETGWTTTLISNEAGLFSIVGLDAGTYYLEETVAPLGYNLLQEDVKVVISATHHETDTTGTTAVTNISQKIAKEEEFTDVDGNVKVTVENFSGATLPETGGIGTTLFYVFGGLLFAGAAVLLITKKRMNEE